MITGRYRQGGQTRRLALALALLFMILPVLSVVHFAFIRHDFDAAGGCVHTYGHYGHTTVPGEQANLPTLQAPHGHDVHFEAELCGFYLAITKQSPGEPAKAWVSGQLRDAVVCDMRPHFCHVRISSVLFCAPKQSPPSCA